MGGFMNRIEERAIANGIQMVPFRKTLREAASAMIDDGIQATAGIHDFGVFYVIENKERFVVRGNEVWKVPGRKVLKLRPSKQDSTKLSTTSQVNIAFKHVYTADLDFAFNATDRSGDFSLTTPTNRNSETWKLNRHTINGKPSYVFALDSLSETQRKAITAPIFNLQDQLIGVRIEHSLTSFYEAVNSLGYSVGNLTVSAVVTAGGTFNVNDATHGSEVIAQFRSCAVNFS